MALTKTQLTIGGIVIAALTASLIVENNSDKTLRRQNEMLQQKMAQFAADNQSLADKAAQRANPFPRLPAPAVQVSNSLASDVDALQSTNFYSRLTNKDFTLKPEQLEGYLKAGKRNAASLLAAYRTTSDPALLSEAMRNFPDDPQVAFEAVFQTNAAPGDLRHWLDVLKKNDPDNALANYLSAFDYFKTGQTDQAVKEFMAASSKPFDDFSGQRYQDDTEAYLAAGYSAADAKAAAGLNLLLPQLRQTRDLGWAMIDLAKSYQQAGDSASAQAAFQMAMGLGARYTTPTPGEPLISQLVGVALQQKVLKAMDPNSSFGENGQTVQDQLNSLTQQRSQMEQQASQVEALMPQLSEQDWIIYRDRWQMYGEQNAGNWVLGKYGQH